METEIRKRREQKKKILLGIEQKKESKIIKFLFSFFSRVGITIVLTLLVFIFLKNDKNLKTTFYKEVFETNFSFAEVNQWYKKIFGSPIPFKEFLKEEEISVFEETLKYEETSKYLDGVSLKVENNYLIPILESGLVVFIGEKEGYGQTVIIQQNNGIDVWYGNLSKENVKLYDYVEKGALLGESDETTLYLVFKKGGEVLDYNEYI